MTTARQVARPSTTERRTARTAVLALALFLGLLALLAPAAHAEPASLDPATPGFVDGRDFVAFATDDGKLVEVNLSGSLLRSLSKSLSKDPDAGEFIGGLRSVTAVIVGIDPKRTGEAAAKIDALGKDLAKRGWEEITRIRDGKTRVRVFVLENGERISGLTAMIISPPDAHAKEHDHEGGEEREETDLVFANIVGPFAAKDIAKITGNLKIEGLDGIADDIDANRAGAGRKGKEAK